MPFPLVVYVALCCATFLPAAFQFQLPTALLPVKRFCEKDLIQWPGLPFCSMGCFLLKFAQNISSIYAIEYYKFSLLDQVDFSRSALYLLGML